MNGKLTVMADPVADALDDMAALGLHWTRNRDRGRMPNGIRQAMLLVAREALAHEGAYVRTNDFVSVCPGADRACGDYAIGWCATCPKRLRA